MAISRKLRGKYSALDVIRIWKNYLKTAQQDAVVRYMETYARGRRKRGKPTQPSTPTTDLLRISAKQETNRLPTITEESIIEDTFLLDLVLRGKTKQLYNLFDGRLTLPETAELILRILRDIIP
jgi:hypothetical protein